MRAGADERRIVLTNEGQQHQRGRALPSRRTTTTNDDADHDDERRPR
jgi:hypothetical protein